jgi:hypothetical protein
MALTRLAESIEEHPLDAGVIVKKFQVARGGNSAARMLEIEST